MKRVLTVRAGYLYIFMGSLLLSGISLFLVYSTFAYVYAHVSPDSFGARTSHWLMNHIGRTPIAVFIFLTIFTAIFMLRSQKTADDMKSLLKAAEGLANKGSFQKLEVASLGELKELAAHLHHINQSGVPSPAGILPPPQVTNEAPAIPLGNDEIMALILRIRSLLRALDDVESIRNGPDDTGQFDMETVKREALGMERLLESLMTAS
ncbi:hypothetical protein MUG84_13110 [Paenibacillus sp. KQZ6P-2]|uniref:Uncharacterized protein n=1 Tax=Paenibacillus mangrovi TaxID=2931978 RepID=A0A9X1WRM2_9BACL|nr:hypothetical protein [Paenibacillus mangrovi]MCJ8012670.1 hypothetical protein [Paenibacillus mangrovi]